MTGSINPFDISNGQKVIHAQLTHRTNDFDRTNYRRLVGNCELISNELSESKTWNLHLLESSAGFLLINLHSALLYRRKWNSLPTVPLSNKNIAELGENASIDKLITELRNGLVHPIDGQCLPNIRHRVNGIDSVAFYLVEGREFGLEYPVGISDFIINRDLSFGCGHLRISLLAQIKPLIEQLKIFPDRIANLPTKTIERELAFRVTGL